MKKNFTTLFFLMALFAKSQSVQWQQSLGGTSYEEAHSIQQTADGGFIIAGQSISNDGDVTGNHGDYDYWIVKSDAAGTIQWQESLGGTGYDAANSVQQTNDGGYIVAGESGSNDGNVSGNHGFSDYWVVKLNASGVIQWQVSLGGSSSDIAHSIQQTADGGYIVAGESTSSNGDVTGHHSFSDYWVVKLNASGTIQWEKSLGGSFGDYAQSIQQTTDGGYIVAGYSESNDGDVSGNHGSSDYWVCKLDASGTIQWQKSLGGSALDMAYSIRQTSDGSYIVAGMSKSKNGNVTGHHGSSLYADFWVVKLSSAGAIKWKKSLGGTNSDWAYSIGQTSDGGYVVAGYTNSIDGDVTGNHGGGGDDWVVKLTAAGIIQWQKSLGGSAYEYARSAQQTTDGGYIIAGHSSSNDGDVSGHHGSTSVSDYWIVKLVVMINPVAQQNILPGSSKVESKNSKIVIAPNPVHSVLHITGLSVIKNYELRIMDESGNVIMHASIKNISSYDIDVSRLAKGIYYLHAGEEKMKFVKE